MPRLNICVLSLVLAQPHQGQAEEPWRGINEIPATEHQLKIKEQRAPWHFGGSDQRAPAGRTEALFGAKIDTTNEGPEGPKWRDAVASTKQERLSQMRQRGEQIRQRLADEWRQKQELIQRESLAALEERMAEARMNVERFRYYGVPSAAYQASDCRRSQTFAPSRFSAPARCSSQVTSCDADAEAEDDAFAPAAGKCGDITTQKIGSFYYSSDGTTTQRIGNFFYGSDGAVTQKIDNFYYHTDGTVTQRIGDFYYDSDGGVTQKVGNFYYHSGGKPCEDDD